MGELVSLSSLSLRDLETAVNDCETDLGDLRVDEPADGVSRGRDLAARVLSLLLLPCPTMGTCTAASAGQQDLVYWARSWLASVHRFAVQLDRHAQLAHLCVAEDRAGGLAAWQGLLQSSAATLLACTEVGWALSPYLAHKIRLSCVKYRQSAHAWTPCAFLCMPCAVSAPRVVCEGPCCSAGPWM